MTKKAHLADLIDVDNSSPGVQQPTGFAVLRQAADTFDVADPGGQAAGRPDASAGIGLGADRYRRDGWMVDQYQDAERLPSISPISTSKRRTRNPSARCWRWPNAGFPSTSSTSTSNGARTRPFGAHMKTSGIGAGQTVVGAFSGNTHGSAIQFGSTPDFVVGIQLVTGAGQSLWIERQSYPVLNDHFVERLGARLVRNDDLFDAAVVSFGAFGIISAVAIETDPIYQLVFPPVEKLGLRGPGYPVGPTGDSRSVSIPRSPTITSTSSTLTTRTGSRWSLPPA